MHESWLPREHSLYRPRHGSQRLALVCALVFFFVPGLSLMLFGPSQTNENRRPHEFPSVADGWGFLTGMSPWANDHLAFKADAIEISDFISRTIFGEPPRFERDVQVPAPGPVAPPTEPTQVPDPGETQDRRPTGGFPQVIEGRDGWLYLGFDSQGKCQPSQSVDEIVNNLRRLKQAVEQSGRTFVLVVAPDKSTMVPEFLPDRYGGKDCAAKAGAQFWGRLSTDTGLLDLRGPLRDESLRQRRPIYFQQDTHWMFDGALIMARELANRLQPGRASTWRVQPGSDWSGPADLPKLIGASGENQAMRYRLAPDGREDRTTWINTDFRTPMTFQTTPVEGMVTKKVAMIADSYTQFASGFLAAGFADITITHVELLLKDTQGVADRLASGDTVVIEVVERHLAAGVSPITNPAFLDTITATLAARPLR